MKSNFIYHPLSFSSLPEAITEKLKLLDRIKQPVEQLFYTGNPKLLESKAIIAIIGSRSPNPYAKALSAQLASKLAKAGASIISGGAMGIDIIAHQNSLPSTIMISPSSLDQIYPPTNAKTIQEIAKKSLILSEYEKAYNPHKYSFLMRNRIIIALADAIIIPYADLKSGSQNSANVALKLDKKLDKKSCQSLLKAIESNPSNALIIEFHISSSKSEAEYMQDARAFANAFSSSAIPVAEVRFFEPSVQESVEFLRARTKELGIEIHTQDLRYILELQNSNLAIAHKELEKFAIGLDSQEGARVVSSEEVRFLCEGIASFSVEELFCALMDKKPFVKILQNIYEEGTSEVMIVRELQRFFYQLFLFFSYIKTHGSLNASEILGFTPPKHILERQRKYCLYFKEVDYIEIFDLLNRWDMDAKSGRSKNSLTTLIKIQAMLR